MILEARSEIAERVRREGYALLRRFEPELSSAEALGRIGRMDVVEGIRPVQRLTPHAVDESTPNTYSGNFGKSAFPLHTDLAHWAIPPRYLALRCIQGCDAVATRLLDGNDVIARFGRSILRRTLTQPRRPQGDRIQLLPLLGGATDVNSAILRWDSIFLQPSNSFSMLVFAEVSGYLSGVAPMEFTLADLGDTLVVDNWRFLHGRSDVSQGGHLRKIDRAYLEAIR